MRLCWLFALHVLFAGTVLAAEPDARPRVAVPAVGEDFGAAAGFGKVVTDQLVHEMRSTGAFAKVVSAREMESLLGFEQQRQSLNCDSASCMAEMAGAMGVDMILTAKLAKVGGSYLLTAQLISVRQAVTLSSGRVRAKASEEAVIDIIPELVAQLLRDASLATHPQSASTQAPANAPVPPRTPDAPRSGPAPVPTQPAPIAPAPGPAPQTPQAPPATTSSPAAAPAETTTTEPTREHSGMRLPVVGVAGAAAAAGVVLGVVAAIVLVVGGLGFVVPAVMHVDTPFKGNARYAVLTFLPAAGAAVGGALFVVAVLVTLGGAGGAAAGWAVM